MNEVERQLRAELKAAAATIERLTQELLEERRSPSRPINARVERMMKEFGERLRNPIPCGHTLGDLIGAPGTVTKCGACLAERQSDQQKDWAKKVRRLT